MPIGRVFTQINYIVFVTERHIDSFQTVPSVPTVPRVPNVRRVPNVPAFFRKRSGTGTMAGNRLNTYRSTLSHFLHYDLSQFVPNPCGTR